MRYLSIFCCFFISATCIFGQEKACTFIQISDPQLGFYEKNQSVTRDSASLEAAVAAINKLKPAFVVCTGDMVNAGESKKQIKVFRRIMSGVDNDIPVWIVPGNHDLGKGATDKRIESYVSEYGYARFSFQYSGCTFIGINSCVIKEGNYHQEDEQFKWLTKQLKKASSSSAVYIFTHYPFFTKEFNEEESYSNQNQANRDKYWALFKKYNVKAVISGHLHSTKDSEYEGIRMFTCGPVGRPLGKGVSGLAIWTLTDGGKSSSAEYVSLEDLAAMTGLE
ncbi:MAG: metallophosphoesterase [Candidatus Cryptobacteroides sp.]